MRRVLVAIACLVLLVPLLADASTSEPPRPPGGLVGTAEATRTVNVLVLRYFPLTADRRNIDMSVTGDVGDPVSTIRAKVDAMTASVVSALSKGSRYRGYANPVAIADLTYNVVSDTEIDTAVPSIPSTLNPNYTRRPDYSAILHSIDVCARVRTQDIREVWIWAYNGPHALDISESKMSGPWGDISNSYRLNDMPACGRTYVVYTYNYQRGTAEAVHDHGHQIEAELSSVDPHLFTDLFMGKVPHPFGVATARCGSDHNPPNARFEYDYANPDPNPSDCLHWTPDGLGATTPISCAAWGCADNGDTDNPQLNWLVWWMQNMPGAGNTVTYGGRRLRDWWDVYYDFDAVMSSCRRLTLPCSSVPLSLTRPAPVRRGARATLTAHAGSGASCGGRITYANGVSARLVTKRVPGSGLLTWSWYVPRATRTGTAIAAVTCSLAGWVSSTRTVSFVVR